MTDSKQIRRAWITTAMGDTTLMHGFRDNEFDGKKDKAKRFQLRAGFAQAEEDLPSRFVGSKRTRKPGSPPPPYLFTAGGLLAMNKSCAEVLRGFDLGDGGLHPITLWEADEVTPVPGDYYLLNFGARKEALLVDQSPHAREVRELKKWSFILDAVLPGEPACMLTSNALEGADMWCDPLVTRAVFVSERLVSALREAEMAELFNFRFCSIKDE
ncbi:MAG: hypothetical protein AAF346_09875 [Pseudomonadota bacterium]